MTETQRRIKELKRALPNMKEKVVAVALLLALSLAMMASVSYAWYTMSLAPEASSITTQVSSNGSLEVALAGLYDEKGVLIAPLASTTADSFAATDQTTKNANLTWGNLINLSGNYGVENLILRPAILAENSTNLLNSIYFGEDGRYDGANVDFGFTSWQEVDGKYTFAVTQGSNYGVRAISTVTYPDGKSALQERLDEAQGIYNAACTEYARIVRNSSDNAYLTVITNLVEVYVNSEANAVLGNSSADADCTIYIDDLYLMMSDLHNKVVAQYGEALAVMANAQLSLTSNNFNPYTLETLVAAGSNQELIKNGVDLGNSYVTFQNMYIQTKSDLLKLQIFAENKASDPVYWSELEPVVDNLIAINEILINGMTMSEFKTAVKNDMFGVLADMKNAVVTVRDGFLRDIELLCGPQLNAQISFKVLNVYGVNATIKTNLYGTTYTTYYNLDKAATEAKANSDDLVYTGTMIAGDTYGMVVDLWVRTNASGKLLMLDGLVSTETHYELRKVVLGGESASRQVFTYTYYVTETLMEQKIEVEYEQYVYLVAADVDGDSTIASYTYAVQVNDETVTLDITEGYFYDVITGFPAYIMDETGETTETKLTHEHLLTSKEVVPTLDSYEIVTGFNSSNRVDEDYKPMFGTTGAISATQGSGSCYIFYAEGPEDYANALQLLEHMKVAFVDFNGTVMAKAVLDVDHVYEDNGKYIVPLVITSSGHQDEDGTYAITMLNQNEATFISAVIYLDGEELENSMVMEKGSIQGSLNLQFATNETKMEPMDNTDLSLKTVTLSAGISQNNFEYNGKAQSTTLTAAVVGLDPENVQATFVRMFNNTQGTRMNTVDLKFVEGTGWVGTPTFTMPGTYILSSLWVDGVEYALPTPIEVTVTGLNIGAISFCPGGDNLALTADSYATRPISVSIAADAESRPGTVDALFKDENGKYTTASLAYDANNDLWSGTVRFTSSGNYKLVYISMDGAYMDVESRGLTFSAYLGLRTNVYLAASDVDQDSGIDVRFEYKGSQEIDVYAEILTDTDEPLRNLDNVKIYYSKLGESVLEKGLNCGLTWNGTYYQGKFTMASVGYYSFAQLAVGTNVITVSDKASTVNCYALTPPSYLRGYMYYGSTNYADVLVKKDSTTVYYVVVMEDADTATTIDLVVKNPSNQEVTIKYNLADTSSQHYLVKNSDGTVSVFFALPNTTNTAVATGNQNGVWTVTNIRCYGVYDAAGNFYGSSDDPDFVVYKPYLDIDEFYGNDTLVDDTFAIVDTVTVSVAAGDLVTMGSAESAAAFMTEQQVPMIPISITTGTVDLAEYDLTVKSAAITFTHKSGTNSKYGGYTYSGTNGNETRGAYPLSMDADGNWYLPANVASVILAGEYTYTVDVVIDKIGDVAEGNGSFADVTFANKTGGETVLKVYSARPEVTVTGISPTAGSSYRMFVGSLATDGTTPEATTKMSGFTSSTYSATVYIYAADAGGVDSEAYTPILPKVTLSITGMPTDKTYTATMLFPNAASSTYDRTFTFTNTATSDTESIGGGINGQNGFYNWGTDTDPKIFPAGKHTERQITVVINEVTYTVNLKNAVTINQPQYPPYVDFVVNDSTFDSGNTPDRIYSTDGETITITLPTVASWDEDESQILSTLPDSISGLTATSASTAYQARYTGYREWTKYAVVTSVYTATASVKSWKVKHEVVSWTDGTNTYYPGDTVTISGTTTLTAVIGTSTHSESTSSETYKRTVVTVTNQGTVSASISSVPSGYTQVYSAPSSSDTGWVKQ